VTVPRASVVIPAHDEAAVIDRALAALRADPAWDDLEVVVVCNGCHDDTAARARAHGARVVETEVASKSVALDLGDRTATAFPRLYLDADVAVGPGAVTALLDCLDVSGAPAASLRVRFDAPGAGRLARWYLQVWSASPHFGSGHLGAGLYALSAAGRARFGRFPADAVSDDLFVMRRFAPAERATADGWFAPLAPATVGDIVRVRRRQMRARWALARQVEVGELVAVEPVEDGRRWLLRLAGQPTWWPPLATFVAVTAWVEATARRQERQAAPATWERDGSTHGPSPAAAARVTP
jgi:glycosyltransferase involved in cell wall biosynthesis